jgi:uncharacterized RDD family membrane protein YckC
MAAPQVTLQSITGVDIELRIAGVGSRSYAFVIDWHIRAMLAFSWWAVGTALSFGGFTSLFNDDAAPSSYYLWVVMPTAVIYFFYHPVLEVLMRGSTPGKRMAGVRIVTRTGDIPNAGALMIRNLFRLIDALPFAYLVGLIATMFTAQHVRIGDIAAGTLLILDGKEHNVSLARLAPANSSLDPRAADLIHELLERWWELEYPTRRELARSLVARTDKSLSPEQVGQLDANELRARLEALVNPTS